jgi:queuine tRNA-ribosyltransferase
VENGVDLFDSVFPTRISRNAMVFTPSGTRSLRREKIRHDVNPIDPDCGCYTCTHYSRAYLRHLFKAREINAAVLATYHNLYFIEQMMKRMRKAIAEGRFREFKRDFLGKYLGR